MWQWSVALPGRDAFIDTSCIDRRRGLQLSSDTRAQAGIVYVGWAHIEATGMWAHSLTNCGVELSAVTGGVAISSLAKYARLALLPQSHRRCQINLPHDHSVFASLDRRSWSCWTWLSPPGADMAEMLHRLFFDDLNLVGVMIKNGIRMHVG